MKSTQRQITTEHDGIDDRRKTLTRQPNTARLSGMEENPIDEKPTECPTIDDFAPVKGRTAADQKRRAQRILERVAAGQPESDALMAEGYAQSTARNRTSMLMRQQAERAGLAEALEDAGVTADRIARVIDEGLDATKPVVTKTSVLAVPDHSARAKFVELAIEHGGHAAPKTTAVVTASWESLVMRSMARKQEAGGA